MKPTNRTLRDREKDSDATRGMSETPDSEDPRLLPAVKEYLAELEAGQRPNRQEFLKRHPEIAQELSACLDGLVFVHSAAAQMQGCAASSAGAASSPGIDPAVASPLGDFKLIREIGRGGMGVVYEAVQLSLGRRVAVKILPFAAALDSRQLQRFRNEAQAAAQLHHTNIVPVYAVGCERSVHYYAMQLIEGQSLADVIRAMRKLAGHPAAGRRRSAASDRSAPATTLDQASAVEAAPQHNTSSQSILRPLSATRALHVPAENLSLLRSSKRLAFFQTVARLGLQAAEALDYAHQHGVVHRDIKPENLLLDTLGTLWITDFGLAQFYEDSGLTQTGDLLGTLRYMSPEQASGRAVVLDERTDIYSLGLTLYELLTLERAIPGETREQLLRQIGSHEPRSPRSIEKNLPPELETILMKAAAKDPADRYPTARTLAEDLRRFLQDEPILARPPSFWDRSVKWTRRHKSLAMSALVTLLIAAAGLLASTLLIAREQGKTKAAYEGEKQQRARAEKSFNHAREVVDFFSRIAAEEMGKPQSFMDIRKQMLEASLAYYQSFLEDRKDDPSIGAELAAAQSRVSAILTERAAFDDFSRAMFRARLLVDESSVRDDLRLSDQQADKIQQYTADFRAKMGAGFPDLGDMSAEQKREIFAGFARTIEDELNSMLAPGQAERLRQISRQVRGLSAFNDPDVSEALSLTREQREAIRAVQTESQPPRFQRRLPEPPRDPGQLQKEAVRNILAKFTPAQVQAWKELTGEPFTGSVFSHDRRPGPPGRRPEHR